MSIRAMILSAKEFMKTSIKLVVDSYYKYL
jgi:hypothetical protein